MLEAMVGLMRNSENCTNKDVEVILLNEINEYIAICPDIRFIDL